MVLRTRVCSPGCLSTPSLGTSCEEGVCSHSGQGRAGECLGPAIQECRARVWSSGVNAPSTADSKLLISGRWLQGWEEKYILSVSPAQHFPGSGSATALSASQTEEWRSLCSIWDQTWGWGGGGPESDLRVHISPKSPLAK